MAQLSDNVKKGLESQLRQLQNKETRQRAALDETLASIAAIQEILHGKG